MTKQIRQYIKDEFPEIEFISAIANIGSAPVDVFFAKFSNEEELNQSWRKISNAIALHYQALLNDEFKKWNTYFFILIEDSISKSLKYEIENDTFSHRKIVKDSIRTTLNSEVIQKFCNDHIGGQGLQLHSITKNLSYTPSSFMKDLIDGSDIDWNNKKENDIKIEEIYNQLLKGINDED